MMHFFKQISVIILALVLVIAVGGFNLIQHYCNCANEVSSSIFIETTDCHDDISPVSCCEVEIITAESFCTEKDEDNPKSHSCTSNDNCCTANYTFLKTDSFDFSVDQKKSFKFIVAYEVILASGYERSEGLFAEYTSFTTDIPPPDYGKELLISILQIKTPDPLV